MKGRRWILGVIALAIVAIAAAGLVFGWFLDEEGGGSEELESESFQVGDAPLSIDVSIEVWVVNGGDGTLSRFPADDPGTAEVIDVGGRPSQVALGGGTVWIAYPVGSTIGRVTEDTGTVEEDIAVGQTPAALAADETGAYVAALDDGSLWKATGAGAEELLHLEGGFPSAVAIGFGSVWVTDVVADQVLRIDPTTGDVDARIDVGAAPTSIVVGDDAVWVSNFNDATVSRIDPNLDEVVGDPVIVGGKPGSLAAGLGYIWVTRPEDDSLIRIDPGRNEWTGEVFETGDNPTGVAVGAGSVWVANTGADSVSRFTPK